ncbi:MAG: hypothetical protein SynsKO_29010 [Synoicihabitans sp.]
MRDIDHQIIGSRFRARDFLVFNDSGGGKNDSVGFHQKVKGRNASKQGNTNLCGQLEANGSRNIH